MRSAFISAELLQQQPEEVRVFDEIALEQPSRLLQEAEEPFQAEAAHPDRSAPHLADRDVEASADAHGERHLYFGLVATEKALFKRRADGDEQQIRATVGDQLDDGGFLVGAPVAIAQAGDLQAGV